MAVRKAPLRRAGGGVSGRRGASRRLACDRVHGAAGASAQEEAPTSAGTTLESVREKPFPERLRVAWSTLFPRREDETARKEAKKRLRMVLVADRCALTRDAMEQMKSRVVHAVSDFVEVEHSQDVGVNLSEDDSAGTMYAVSIPVRRVHPSASAAAAELASEAGEDAEAELQQHFGGPTSKSTTSPSVYDRSSEWRIY